MTSKKEMARLIAQMQTRRKQRSGCGSGTRQCAEVCGTFRFPQCNMTQWAGGADTGTAQREGFEASGDRGADPHQRKSDLRQAAPTF